MKNYLKIIIPILFLLAISFMSYKVINKINHKKEVAEHIKKIPQFEYQNLDGGVFSNKDLKSNTPIVFLYFNSECEHCQNEADMIRNNIDKFSSFQLIFISFEKPEMIEQFAIKYHLLSYDNVRFICDTKVAFATTFDVNSLPCIVLYDKNQQLIEKIKGQTKAENLIKKLNN